MPSRRFLVSSIALVLLATGCNSTLRTGRTSQNHGPAAVGRDAASPTATAGTAGQASRGGASGAGSVASAPVSGARTPASAGITSRFIAAHAPGVTDKTIYIGVGYSSQSAAGDKAIGAAAAGPTYDTRNVFNAIISYANAHGGFAGRALKPLYYDYNLTTATSTQDQSACAFWTQDNKVFAMGGGDDILDACADRAGALAIGAGSATAATFAKYRHLIDPDAITLDRLGQVTVAGLARAGYFGGKLGLVTWDDPNYRAAIASGYLPALAKIGVKPAQTTYIGVPQQLGAVADMTAAVTGAITKFKALGIDHVIIQDGPAGVWAGTGLTLEWMVQSQAQGYHPRYGQNTFNSPGWSVLPAAQMDHAIAVDQSDYDRSKDAGWRTNTFRDACFKIEADAGYPVTSSNLNDEAIAGAACDTAFFMQRIVNALPALSADSFISQAEKLGTSMPSAVVYGTKLLPGRRDGGDMVRTEEYLASCKCLRYRGAPYYAD